MPSSQDMPSLGLKRVPFAICIRQGYFQFAVHRPSPCFPARKSPWRVSSGFPEMHRHCVDAYRCADILLFKIEPSALTTQHVGKRVFDVTIFADRHFTTLCPVAALPQDCAILHRPPPHMPSRPGASR